MAEPSTVEAAEETADLASAALAEVQFDHEEACEKGGGKVSIGGKKRKERKENAPRP